MIWVMLTAKQQLPKKKVFAKFDPSTYITEFNKLQVMCVVYIYNSLMFTLREYNIDITCSANIS